MKKRASEGFRKALEIVIKAQKAAPERDEALRFDSGMDELRNLVAFGDHSQESAFDGFSVFETILLLQACIRLDLEVLPDQLTRAERVEAGQTGTISKATLRRLYAVEGLPETGPDWEGV